MCNSTSAQCMSYPGGKVKSIALGRFSILEPRKRDFVRFSGGARSRNLGGHLRGNMHFGGAR